MSETLLFALLDLAGTFVFALSGATAAKQRNLDLFGIIASAFIVACGGGIVRDLCIGVIPPTGLSEWRYMAVSLLAVLAVIGAYKGWYASHIPYGSLMVWAWACSRSPARTRP